MWVVSRRPFDRSNNNYVTAFHLAGRPPVKDSQPCATDKDSGLCGLLTARRRVTITCRHTVTTDSPVFTLAPMLLMSDMRIGLTLLSFFRRGAVGRVSDSRSRGRGFESRPGTRRKNSGHVSDTCVPLFTKQYKLVPAKGR